MTAPLATGALTIFGITGDLAARKLLPALYHLLVDGLMPDNFVIIGVSRRPTTIEALMNQLVETLELQDKCVDPALIKQLASLFTLMQIDMTNSAGFVALRTHLEELEENMNVCLNRLFYLAIPPSAFGGLVDALGAAGLNTGCQHQVTQSRLLLEKPFGSDLASAKTLIKRLEQSFDDHQIYRIDHYLAKETAQNILVFRFQNPLFRACWDERLIENITITAAEALGVEQRANFYDQTGALRDIVQSHLLQLLALVTMDEPAEMTAKAIKAEKQKLLEAISPLTPGQVPDWTVRGQYSSYTADTGIKNSTTETYVALRLNIDNERWHGVPIILRTGKAMATKTTTINIAFRQSAHPQTPANNLTIRLQPNEGIGVELVAKKPGFASVTQTVSMDFGYHQAFEGQHLPDAYERVLIDAFLGDQTLFATAAEELITWQLMQPILDGWAAGNALPELYQPGSWGPARAQLLAKSAGALWPNP